MSASTGSGLRPDRRDSLSTFDGGIRIDSVDQDIDRNAGHVTVNILSITDEATAIVKAPLLRVGSGNRLATDEVALRVTALLFGVDDGERLARNLLDESIDELEQPLLEQRATRIDVSDENASGAPRGLQCTYSASEIEEEGEAAAGTCSRLVSSILRYLWLGYKWTSTLLALGLYAMFLLPGFLQVGYQYFFSRNIHRGIVYGNNARNRLDLYAPEDVSTPKKVVIFVTGGAWIIGYRAWGALLGIQLSERDIMVCSVDYRNFPQGKISDMIEDVSTGIGFIVNNIAQFGGDPDRIYIAGQSAGSHIASCALVEHAQMEMENKGVPLTWKSSQIKAFLGVSGAYNLPSLVEHFHERGLHRDTFFNLMEAETSLPHYSPELAVQTEAFAPAVPLLPPIYLFHGTGDYSIPSEASENFGSVLQQVGATVVTKLYLGKTHTDVILQDPMRGGRDALFDDFLAVCHADDEAAQARDAIAPLRPRLVPECLLQLAHLVSPF